MGRTRHVYLLKHGHTLFNAAYGLTGEDPFIFDARLSDLGRQQVAEVADDVRRLDLDLIVPSPLTRALETAVGLTDGASPLIVVQALHRERMTNSCDVGRHPSLLARDFSGLEFGHLAPVWWHTGSSCAIRRLRRWPVPAAG